MVKFQPYIFSPIYWHVREALNDPSISHIKLYGGSSSSHINGYLHYANQASYLFNKKMSFSTNNPSYKDPYKFANNNFTKLLNASNNKSNYQYYNNTNNPNDTKFLKESTY